MAEARTRRRRRRARAWVPALLVVALAGAYVAADVVDVAPGVLTTRPEVTDPPLPTADALPAAVPAAVPGPAEDAPQPDPAAIGALTDTLLAAAEVGPSAGVLVVDVASGDELAASSADDPHVPASTTKLLTATAAIAAVGPDHVLTTRVVETEDGDVVLVAGGDLTLAAGAGDPDAVIGRAGLADLAEQTAEALLAQGRTSVAVGLDLGYYTGPEMPPRWDAIDLSVGDAMSMAPLAIDIGRLDGQLARTTDPAGAAAAAFVAALADAGVTVDGAVAPVTAPEGATELAAVSSAPMGELAAYMLQVSENILAEAIGRVVAHELEEEPSFLGAGLAIGEVLAAEGIDVAGLSLADCSGLSSTNQISPRTLVETLRAIVATPGLGDVARGLPVAGLEGTLSDRLEEAPAAGLVAAKTGTLRAVVALAGYVTTADGRLLAFATLAGAVPAGGTSAARDAVDAFAAGLAGCGC